MVADEDGSAGGPRGIEAAASVREHHGGAAGRSCRAHRVGDGIDPALLVQVRAAEEDEHSLAARVDAPHPAGVALDRGG